MPQLVRKIVPPSLGTLRSYGLTEAAWRAICVRQRWCCPICREPFGDRKLAIDHAHVAGFKARKRRKGKRKRDGVRPDVRVRIMSTEERVSHVRGVLHAFCNRMVRRWMTLERTENILEYLKAHQQRQISEEIQ